MPVDVLQHDDGVIHHEPDGQHESQQRQRVDRDTRDIHDGKGGDERNRDGDHRDDRRPEGVQEQEDDENDQARRLHDCREHILDRPVDKQRRVKAHFDRSSFRHRLVDRWQHAVDRNCHVKRVGDRLLHDADRDGRLPVITALAPDIGRSKLNLRHIAQRDLQAPRRLERHPREFFGRAKRGARQHSELAVRAFHPACRDFGILRPDRRLDVLHRDSIACEFSRIEPDPHDVTPLAIHRNVGHAVQILEPVGHEAVHVIRELKRRHPGGAQHEKDDGLRVRFNLGDCRLVDFIGKLAAHPAHPVAHIAGGRIDADARPEADGDPA